MDNSVNRRVNQIAEAIAVFRHCQPEVDIRVAWPPEPDHIVDRITQPEFGKADRLQSPYDAVQLLLHVADARHDELKPICRLLGAPLL